MKVFNINILYGRKVKFSIGYTYTSIPRPIPLFILVFCVAFYIVFTFCTDVRLTSHFIAARCYEQAWPMPSGDVRLSGTFVYSVETNKCIFRIASPSGSHTILVFAYQALWQYSDGDSPNGASNADGVGKHRDSQSISGYMLTVRLPSVIHSAAMDHGNVMTVAGKRRRLFFTVDDDEVFMTRSLKISPNTTEQHLIVRTRKREAEIIIKDCAQGIILLKLSTDRHKASRDLCDSRATCNTRNSAVAERPRDASSLSVVKSTILRVQSFITSYFGFTFTITNANNLILFCSLRRATETCRHKQDNES